MLHHFGDGGAGGTRSAVLCVWGVPEALCTVGFTQLSCSDKRHVCLVPPARALPLPWAPPDSPGARSRCADARLPAPDSQPPALAATFLEQPGLRAGLMSPCPRVSPYPARWLRPAPGHCALCAILCCSGARGVPHPQPFAGEASGGCKVPQQDGVLLWARGPCPRRLGGAEVSGGCRALSSASSSSP